MSNLHKNYLFDLGYLLRELALDAKREFTEARGTPIEAYESGRAYAYFEVISLLLQQAQSFDLPVEDLHLDGLVPDRDLLSPA